ncbi:hypothetical protein BROUX41_001034 [Berkeleyomyces rouxiae]|uniref:uncharacterized protein n=1 Tax=Berkeleyomyces rouxiae TaxID=2035830 RepID=UPI003B78264E
MALSDAQAKLVKATIPIITSYGDLPTITFYRSLLSARPDLSAIFNSASQANGRQPRALTQLVLAFAQHIDSLSQLTPVLERVCQKHVSLNVQATDYAVVGQHLLEAFGTVIGPQIFTPDVAAAWGQAYGILADILMGREARLYSSFGEWIGFRTFTISRKVKETQTNDIFSFYLVPAADKQGNVPPLPNFRPGQYVSVQIPVTGRNGVTKQTRQYSLSDRPCSEYYRITVKREVNDDTGLGTVSCALIDNFNVGDTVQLSHPAGEFFLNSDSPASSAPVVMISAGIGVTPMMSILNSLLGGSSPGENTKSQDSDSKPNQECRRPITWVHGCHTDTVFETEIRDIAKGQHSFHATIFKSAPEANAVSGTDFNFARRVDLDKLSDDELYLARDDTDYLVCGPEGFMLDVRSALARRGVKVTKVKCELFNTGELLASSK